MKVFEVLRQGLEQFSLLEDYEQESVADYIACPNSYDCKYDGGHDRSVCTECKIKWLNSEWEY